MLEQESQFSHNLFVNYSVEFWIMFPNLIELCYIDVMKSIISSKVRS